jgi:hypothetical protein
MNLNNLTGNTSPHNVLSNFYGRRSEKLVENEREPEINANSILIPQRMINGLKKSSGFFEAFIDRNFTNSNDFFDEKGNYILKKDLLPERFYYYDRNSNTEYIFKRNQVWNALTAALLDGHVPDAVLARFIADWFIFDKNVNFFNPTLPESKTVHVPKSVYFPAPGKKERQRERKYEREERLYNLGLFNDLTNKEKRKEQLLELKQELQELNRANVEALAEAAFGNNEKTSLVLAETGKATRVYSKYPKSGKRPSKTSRKTIEHRGNKIRENVRRKTARKTKSNKRRYTNNNNERVGYGNSNK